MFNFFFANTYSQKDYKIKLCLNIFLKEESCRNGFYVIWVAKMGCRTKKVENTVLESELFKKKGTKPKN